MKRSILTGALKGKEMLKAIPILLLILVLVLTAVVTTTTPAFAAGPIAQRGAVTTATTTGTSLTINKPAGVVAGDVMLVNIAQVGNNSSAPNSTGWTLVAGADIGGSTARYGAVLYRVSNGTEGASFTFTLGSGTNG